jgi:hypothetical protein
MIIKIEDLKKDDEIMLACGSNFVFAKVIRPPMLRYKKDKVTGVREPVMYKYSTPSYHLHSSVKCQVKTKTLSKPSFYSGGKDITWKEYDNSLEDYNDEKYFNLNGRQIWLIE